MLSRMRLACLFLSLLVLSLLVLGSSLRRVEAAPSAKEQAQAHFKQGAAYYAEGAYERALGEYETAYALLPLPEILFNIGQAHRMRGQRTLAIAAYQRYLDSRPDGAPSDLARHYVAALQHEEDEARVQAERSSKQAPAVAIAPVESAPVAPRAVIVAPAPIPRRTPIYKRWWVWTIVGVGAVGLGVGLGVGLTRPHFNATLHPDLTEGALVQP